MPIPPLPQRLLSNGRLGNDSTAGAYKLYDRNSDMPERWQRSSVLDFCVKFVRDELQGPLGHDARMAYRALMQRERPPTNRDTTRSEDKALARFFRDHFPEVQMFAGDFEDVGATPRVARPTSIGINYQLIHDFNDCNNAQIQENILFQIILTIHHELAHVLWRWHHGGEINTDEEFSSIRTVEARPVDQRERAGSDRQGESGFWVEIQLFGGTIKEQFYSQVGFGPGRSWTRLMAITVEKEIPRAGRRTPEIDVFTIKPEVISGMLDGRFLRRLTEDDKASSTSPGQLTTKRTRFLNARYHPYSRRRRMDESTGVVHDFMDLNELAARYGGFWQR